MPRRVHGLRPQLVQQQLVLKLTVSFAILVGCSSDSFAARLLGDVNSDNVVIVVPANQSVGHDFDAYLRAPFNLTRNVTVTGADGLNSVLDLKFLHGVVQLCSSCIFTFKNITIANERRGNGSPMDFFSGKPGSVVVLEDVQRLRLACASSPDSATVVDYTPRSRLLPHVTAPQDYTVEDVVFQGRLYPRTLVTKDYTADIPFEVQEDRSPQGGYALRAVDMHRLCQNTIPDACLAKKSTEVCINEMIDSLLAGQAAPSAGSGAKAAIVAPVVVAGTLLLVALVAGLLWLRERRARQKQLLLSTPATKPDLSSNSRMCNTSNGYTMRSHPTSDGDHVEMGLNCSKMSSPISTAYGAAGTAGAGRTGWTISSCFTSPALGEVQDNKIHFGELLGAGSYGRVFKAKWAGHDVAVKVMEHEHSNTQDVENEVKLMMACDSDAIVQAYHFVTYTNSSAAPGGSAGQSSGIAARQRGRARRSIDCQRMISQTSDVLTSSGAAAGQPIGSAHTNSTSHSSQLLLLLQQQQKQKHDQHQQDQQQQQDDKQAGTATSSGPSSSGNPRSLECSPGSNPALQDGSGLGWAPRDSPASSGAGGTAGISTTSVPSSGFDSKGYVGDTSRPMDDNTPSSRAESHLVLEYCDCGTLGQVMTSLKQQQQQQPHRGGGQATEAVLLQLLLLLQDVARGLKELHGRNIVHGDLNARNVLVSSSPAAAAGLAAKLCDFGLSRTIKQHHTHRSTKACGTITHCSPELLTNGHMSPAVDVYAYGIMMWELFTGSLAFRQLHYGAFYSEVVLKGLRPCIPSAMPPDYRSLVEQCWAAEPDARPKADQLLEALAAMIAARPVLGPQA